MKVHITIKRMGEGALTQLKTEYGQASKKYFFWREALHDARNLGLLSDAIMESASASEGPLYATAEVDPSTFYARGFLAEKVDPR